MSTIAEHRATFVSKMKRDVKGDDRERFEAVLDDFVQWSSQQSSLEFFEKDAAKGVISFRRSGSGPVFWAAYPRLAGGAQFEILPRAVNALPPEVRAMALEVLQPICSEPLDEANTFRVPFQAMKAPATRKRVKEVLAKLL